MHPLTGCPSSSGTPDLWSLVPVKPYTHRVDILPLPHCDRCRSKVSEPAKFQLASISYSMQRWTRNPYNSPGPFKFSSKFSLPASTQPEVILNSQASNRGPREVHAHERAIATQYQFSVSTQSMVSAQPAVTLNSSTHSNTAPNSAHQHPLNQR